MRLFNIRSCCGENSGADPLRLAVIAALFVLIGDFITFVLAIIAVQEDSLEQENNRKELEQRIIDLQKSLDELRRK